MKISLHVACLVLWVGTAGLSCSPRAGTRRTETLPSVLVVPARAKAVKPETTPQGQIGVTYTLDESYPAEGILQTIRAALQAPEWTPLQEDWLNPGRPTSHARGWSAFTDATLKPPAEVHQWLAQWQDSQGNIVWYALRYTSRYSSPGANTTHPNNTNLSVTAVWEPAALAREMRSSVVPDRRSR